MPVQSYTHENILEILAPHATRSWVKRFMAVKDQGPARWLLVVRDFNIQHQSVEYMVDDIVRALEPSPANKSLVRAEMEKLESEGKLDLSTPEKADYWQKRLDEESEQNLEWMKEDEEARARQRKADLEFLAQKASSGTLVIPMKNQDPKNELKSKKISDSSEEFDPIPEGPAPVISIKPPKPAPENAPKAEHAKELSETEKKQLAFKPKPAPEKEPEYKEPTIKSVDAVQDDGSITNVYQKPDSSIESVEGLNPDAIKRLRDNGINTKEQLELAGAEKLKSILGMPVYQSIKDRFKN